jgi:hypothetical protein
MLNDTMPTLQCIMDVLPPMRVCAWCDLPVPIDQHEDEPYCDSNCQEAHVDTAIQGMLLDEAVKSLAPIHTAVSKVDLYPVPCSCHKPMEVPVDALEAIAKMLGEPQEPTFHLRRAMSGLANRNRGRK